MYANVFYFFFYLYIKLEEKIIKLTEHLPKSKLMFNKQAMKNGIKIFIF